MDGSTDCADLHRFRDPEQRLWGFLKSVKICAICGQKPLGIDLGNPLGLRLCRAGFICVHLRLFPPGSIAIRCPGGPLLSPK